MRRLTFLGDSNSNGHGVPDVGKRFVNILRENNPGWEIHFLGGDGYDTGQLLETLQRWIGGGYQLDRVVYVYCLNDISDLIPEWQQAARRLYSERPGFPFSGSYFLNTFYYRLKALTDPDMTLYFDRVAAAYENDLWSLQQQRLQRLHELITGGDGELLVVTFPFLERMDSPAYQAIHDKLADFWWQRDLPYLDLAGSFRGIPLEDLTVNAQDTHPNEQGHRLAARSIERFLEEHLPGLAAGSHGR
jgi:lysophospholipase L1-like esterase